MFDDRSPIYQQIADKIKDDIISGILQEDEQVMSTNQYAAFYRINPATAAKGFHLLTEEGILYKKRGIGMFVNGEARQLLLAQRRDRFLKRSSIKCLWKLRKLVSLLQISLVASNK